MTVLLLILAWLVGVVAAAFVLAPPVIILAFALPFTFEMKGRGVPRSAAPALRYFISFVLLITLFGFLSWAIWHYLQGYFWGYGLGVTLTLLPSLRKCGRTPTNIAEYFETNDEYVNKDRLAHWQTEGGAE